MEIKVKSVKAKEASVSIGLDLQTASVLSEFLGIAVNNLEIIEATAEAFGCEVNEVSELIIALTAELDGGLV